MTFWGYSLQEAVRLKAWEVVVPAEHRRFKKNLRALLRGEPPKPERQFFTALKKDLTTFRVELTMEVADVQISHLSRGCCAMSPTSNSIKKEIDHFQRMETIATMAGIPDTPSKAA